jgi:hypothetical protein
MTTAKVALAIQRLDVQHPCGDPVHGGLAPV